MMDKELGREIPTSQMQFMHTARKRREKFNVYYALKGTVLDKADFQSFKMEHTLAICA